MLKESRTPCRTAVCSNCRLCRPGSWYFTSTFCLTNSLLVKLGIVGPALPMRLYMFNRESRERVSEASSSQGGWSVQSLGRPCWYGSWAAKALCKLAENTFTWKNLKPIKCKPGCYNALNLTIRLWLPTILCKQFLFWLYLYDTQCFLPVWW